MTAETPVDTRRKVDRGEMAPGCPAHADPDGVWHIQDYPAAKAMLRHGDTVQAGFGAEHSQRMSGKRRPSVLHRDGAEHREHRRQTAKFFTPRRVDTAYRSLMERLADEQCAELTRRGEADLSRLSFNLAVAVAAEVLGLIGGPGSMARRLERFFEGMPDGTEQKRSQKLVRLARSVSRVNAFYLLDVRPSIRARRRARQDDLISHLIDEGCSNSEILGECITFGAAGMITTREFITLSAWHLFGDDDLRKTYVEGDEKARYGVLHEILRLEPVVANLTRKATADIPLGDVTIPAGARIDIGLAAANLDTNAVGADPGAVCPARPLADGVAEPGLSFGEGPHRCPGAYIAIQETDIFLTRLFAMPGLRMVREPRVGLRPAIASYELVNLRVAVN